MSGQPFQAAACLPAQGNVTSNDQNELVSDPALRDVPTIAGYKVLKPCVLYGFIGHGAVGRVYLAWNMDLEIDVAVKCLTARQQAIRERFGMEAKLAAKISHQNLVRVFGSANRHGLQYFWMEYIEGETLRDRVDRKGPLAVEEAMTLLHGAALGVGKAHQIEIVHCDIKPANVLVNLTGEVKVTDLGMAHPMRMEPSREMVAGTLRYMAPEQWLDASRISPASDVYSLGALLYFLLTGKDPNEGRDPALFRERRAGMPFPDVREHRTDLDEDVIRLLDTCTRGNPADRFDDANEIVRVIEARGFHAAALLDESERETFYIRRHERPPQSVIYDIHGSLGDSVIFSVATRPSSAKLPDWAEPVEGAKFHPDLELPLQVLHRRTGIEMVLVPPGRFQMGREGRIDDDGPVHPVEITSPFYLGKHPVTQGQWERVMGENPSTFAGSDHPVETVSWDQALAFAENADLSLPREAEWEWAALGGDNKDYPWGDGQIAPYFAHYRAEGQPRKTKSVGSIQYGRSWCGALDMIGNVWEWCSDYYQRSFYSTCQGLVQDPVGPSAGDGMVCRGGSWNDPDEFCHGKYRLSVEPHLRFDWLGLRVCKRL